MFKITFLGAGSTIFVKNVLGDCILTERFEPFEIALFDIDPVRLDDSKRMLDNINKKYRGKADIRAYADRRAALKDAKYVVNAIQVGGYEPCTATDFEVPKKYGLRQTIADTLGIGGIFRALRTIPVLEDFAEDMHAVCPDALFINYANPMAMLTGYIQRYLGLNAVGLCHSVQYCVKGLFETLDMTEHLDTCRWKIAGINHQAWLLDVRDRNGNDLYPEIKRRSLAPEYAENIAKWDSVRHEIMHRFGYYNTESSEHTAEYSPYFIKSKYPELIERYHIPLDEYPRRCEKQIAEWGELREKVVSDSVEHTKSIEFAAHIVEAMEFDTPYRIHGNVLNRGLITNLPSDACVEVPCMVDRNGVNPCVVGDLPEQCAALNRTNVNVQLMTIEAARTRKKEAVYMAAYLDPHTAAELSLDNIKALCDDLFAAHGAYIPAYR